MMLVCLLLAACLVALANGPAWVAELSAIDPPTRDALRVTIPIGTHVTVGVYNSDAVEPLAPDGVTATVRIIWSEQRTVFHGTALERNVSVPYYLPPVGQATPTGAFAVEIEPSAVGTYTVPIRCNSNTVTVTVDVIDIPDSDIGYGFYTDYVRFADPLRGREYARHQARHGMNTFTPYARELPAEFGVDNRDAAALLAWHIETGLSEGLVDRRFPLLCLSCGPDDIKAAQVRFGRPEWPELVSYNQDEPPVSAADTVRRYAEDAKALGLRSGTAIDGEIAMQIGDPLDIWILHMDSMSAQAIDAAQEKGKARWLYNCAMRGSNAPLERYWAGVYTWAVDPEVCLTSAYMHDAESRIMPDGTWRMSRYYGKAAADKDGMPLPTVALKGMADGIIDSRLLQELARRDTPAGNAYLESLRARVPVDFWPDGKRRDWNSGVPGYYVWDIPDVSVPPIDMVEMREELVRLLGLKAGD